MMKKKSGTCPPLRSTFFTALAFLFLLSPMLLSGQNRNIQSQKERIRNLEEDIAFLDKQIRTTQQQHKNSLQELTLLQRKTTEKKKLLDEIDRQITAQNREIQSKDAELKRLENRLDTLEYYHRRLILNAYKNRDTRIWFMYILASNDIEQGYRRWNYLKNYSRSIREQAGKIKETRLRVVERKAELARLKSETLRTQEQREQEYRGLVKARQQSQNYVKSLAGKQTQFKRQLAQKKNEADKLNRELQKMLAAAMKPAGSGKTGQTGTPKANAEENIRLTGDFQNNKGKLPWPVQGVVIEQFGEHNHPLFKGVKLPFNNGINISCSKNATVKAVFGGTVKQVIVIPGYNHCVLVQHGSYFTFYCKLGTVSVKAGQKLAIGEPLGTADDTVLHFELWNGTAKQNPELWLKSR